MESTTPTTVVKTTWNLNHFNSQNTPLVAQIIGDISMIVSFIGGLVLIFQANHLAVPPELASMALYAAVGGGALKLFTKTFGITDENGNPVNPHAVIQTIPVTDGKIITNPPIVETTKSITGNNNPPISVESVDYSEKKS